MLLVDFNSLISNSIKNHFLDKSMLFNPNAIIGFDTIIMSTFLNYIFLFSSLLLFLVYGAMCIDNVSGVYYIFAFIINCVH